MADNNVVGGVDKNSVRFIHHLIRNSRRRRLMMQLTVHYLFARRRRLLSVCLISLLMLLSQRRVITQLPRRRSCRRLVRNTGWWENVWNNYSEARFKKTFRISRATFRYILDRIEPILPQGTPSHLHHNIYKSNYPKLRLLNEKLLTSLRLGQRSVLWQVKRSDISRVL